jgi:macrolide-specific efflux system membrane fusion protein
MAEVAKADYDQAVEINRKSPRTVSETEVRRLKLTWERGVLQKEVAELELSVAKLTAIAKKTAMDAADNEIRRRKLVAPMDAIVDQVMAKHDEWVQPGQPMMELVRIDKLRMEAYLNASEVSPLEVAGRNVVIEITVKDPRSEKSKIERFESKINFVSSQIVADGAYRIATDFDNRQDGDEWVVRPGMIGNMTIKLAGNTQSVAKPVVKPEAPRLTPVSNK